MSCTAAKILSQADFKKPQAEFVDYQITKKSLSGFEAVINLKVFNPNTFGIKDLSLNYQLASEHGVIFRGDNAAIAIQPQATTYLSLPIKIRYKSLLKVIPDLAEPIVFSQDHLLAKATVGLNYAPTIYNKKEQGGLYLITNKITKEVKIPLPKKKIDKFKRKLKDKFKKLF